MKNKHIKILILLGIIILIIVAIRIISYQIILKSIEKEQGMLVFINSEASEEEIKKIGDEIKTITGVLSVEYVSKEDAYNQMKNRLADRQELLEGLDPSIFPSSYIVILEDIRKNDYVQNKIKELENIKSINTNNNILLEKLKININLPNFKKNNNITRENYEKIELNMTKAEVFEILGEKDAISVSETSGIGKMEIYKYKSNYGNIQVWFLDGEVERKNWTE